MTDSASQKDSADQVADKPRRQGSGRGRVLLVTGMSGAGKSSALKGLEDLGYEAVDNLPLSLVDDLVGPRPDFSRPSAIGVDIRTRDFSVDRFLGELDSLLTHSDLDVRLVFVDCDDEVLRRRYTETRRRHPLAADRPVMDGINTERKMLSQLRERADVVVDTSGLKLADLRRLLQGHFGLDKGPGVSVFVTSFSYRNGLPREADLVFDVRFLTNPYYDTELRPLTGRDDRVAGYIAADTAFLPFFDGLTGMLLPLLPRFDHEGKSYLTIAIGCTGGRHRSVFVAERLTAWLMENRQRVSLRHRDLDEDADGDQR